MDESAHPPESVALMRRIRRDRWVNSERTPCAWCTRDAFRVTTDRPSVRSFVRSFVLRVSAWQKRERYDLLLSVPAARSFFVFGFRNFSSEISGPDKSRPRYRRCRDRWEKRRKRGETNKAHLSVFDSFRLLAGLKATSVKGYSAVSLLTKRAKQPFSFSFPFFICSRENLRDIPLGDRRAISAGFYCGRSSKIRFGDSTLCG